MDLFYMMVVMLLSIFIFLCGTIFGALIIERGLQKKKE